MNTSNKNLRVLVLDDDPLVLSGTTLLLESLGHNVTQSACGEDVLRIMSDGDRFDVAILDLSIRHGLGAQDIVQQLSETDPSMKKVVSSGFRTEDLVRENSEFGFDAGLPKPFTRRDLANLIARLFPE